ncbi:MAG: response regulator transcription factor [Nocardioides sp.]|nr:response regulator transcription factor [Nocardioides sp.]
MRAALVVEDDPDIGALLELVLEQAGFEVHTATDGNDALTKFAELSPELVTLDLSLPGVDGMEVCRRIRRTSSAYLIMLTARHEEVDRLMGLEIGADDYMTKPFSLRELSARVAALYRRPAAMGDLAVPPETGGDADEIDCGGGLVLSTSRREARLSGGAVPLTRTEYDLLERMARHPGTAQDRRTLVQHVWRGEQSPSGHLVDVHVANLRRKLAGHAGSAPWIQTVRGIGYRFDRAQ